MQCSRSNVRFLFSFILATIVCSGCAASRFSYVDVYIRQQNWQQARIALEEAVRQNPTDGEAHLQLAEVYAELGMIPQMTATLASAEAISRHHSEMAGYVRRKYWIENYKKGNLRFDEHLYTEAALHFRRAVQIDSSNIESLTRYADALLMSNRYREAERTYGVVLQRNPGAVAAKSNLAEIYFMQKKFAECATLCSEILEKDDTDLQALTRRAYAYDALDYFENAEKDFLLVTTLQPTARLEVDLGLLYFRHGKYAKAIAHFNEALTFLQSNILVYRHLGEAYWRMRDYEGMTRAYQRIVQAYPDDLIGWKNLAVAYEALGKKEQLAEARHFISRISSTN